MNKGQIILTLTLSLFAASVAWAQGDENQPPAPSPVPAFGQENPVPAVSENPPISAIDLPGLEPHAAPESFLLPGLHFSESVDSNVGNRLGGSSTSSVTRALGSLTLQKLWKNYDVAVDYIGGAAYYARKGIGLEQLQQLDIDNRINWKRGQLAIREPTVGVELTTRAWEAWERACWGLEHSAGRTTPSTEEAAFLSARCPALRIWDWPTSSRT